MTRDILVGLDLGSTSFKAVAVSLDGDELAMASVATPWDRSELGTTMSATATEAAAQDVLRQCLDQISDPRVIAAGMTGMAEAGFLVDDAGAVWSDAYAWFDERGRAEREQLSAELTSRWFSSMTGLPLSVRCSAIKIKASAASRASMNGVRWESLPEWIARRFGGEPRAELSLAARTGLMNIHTHDWEPDLLSWSGVDADRMAQPQRAGATWGIGRSGSLLDGAVLTVAGQDHVCAAIGTRAQGDSDVLDSIGTGEAVLCASEPLDASTTLRAVGAGLTVGVHVVPDRHLVMAGLGTGGRLSTVLTLLGVMTREQLEQLNSSADFSGGTRETAEWAAEIVHDGAATSRVPENIEEPVAAWQSAVAAAGVRLDDAIDRLERFSGEHDRVVSTGGWYRSIPFRRLRTASVRRRLNISSVTEATGVGAALIAGVAADVYPHALSVPEPAVEKL
ncbi:FGGY family carbohydrate kinase [Paramicrobacterium chengjingii]|uniref:Carbohydrate kinase FGGY N-terminal domain-containing protein n=1 Tax=Paramicrobacterium chengjingii TaxID=2769067 RepID=A0ABX6YHH7_9MICO|nr:FGGY family carbohydrate kinase [Microbacterium chengjingii]QPZ38243.1 hypothetical protein HCR76_15870 [Microbacterium chengjingii]